MQNSSKRLFWSREDGNPSILSNAIRYTSFKAINHHLHFNDNSRINSDYCLYKLRPLLNYPAKKFLDLGVNKDHLSLKEFMASYFVGSVHCRFFKRKPMQFSSKNWGFYTSPRYTLAFDVYIKQMMHLTKTTT